ncbi:hypothetical protein PybrP1_013026 [[Pythium] brassicae (nom. inval.)]|nr:hypothetical protein PybrP1_013026 [[Pythium] brassicae (nom. inval.)]
MYSVTTAKSLAHTRLVVSKGSLRAAPRELANHSYANVHEVSFQHLHWVLELDFAAQQLRGSAEYTFSYNLAAGSGSAEPPGETTPVVVLDTRGLGIERVFVDGRAAQFELQDARDATFGRALVVPVAAHAKKLRVTYVTLPPDDSTASALHWLPKELTAGGTYPLLFTQCQPIHARSVVPAPDTPAAKFTYTAVVTAPEWSTVLMSAIVDEASQHKRKAAVAVPPGKRVVSFRQDVPVPAYLLAIAAGRLESAELGPRSRVWAEPTVVARAAHEFAQTEAFLAHAEAVTAQPYVWTRCDLVCLPPSFSYGGVANPCLMFVPPTLLAGDRSLADAVAHEIAHAWTGNLVTHRSWRDVWLNEGWTLWLERKIQARVLGDPLAYDLKAAMGLRDLVEAYFTETVDRRAALAQVDWHAWFHAPGLPPVAPRFDTTLSAPALALAEQMLARPDDPSAWAAVVSANALNKWPAALWILLLDTLLRQQQPVAADSNSCGRLSAAHLDAIDAFSGHHLTTTQNAELRFRWYTLALRAGDARALRKVAGFLREQGRLKFVRPLFRDLCKAAGPAHAAKVFAQSRRVYHPLAVERVQRDLESALAAAAAAATSERRRAGLEATLARWLGIPEAYAGYSPVAALALTAAVVGTAAVIVARRRR